MKRRPSKDRHHGLQAISESALELQRCLAPLIPFEVEYSPWIDKIVWNLRRDVRGAVKRFEDAFGKPKPRPPKGDKSSKWVRQFVADGSHRIDFETYDVNDFRHGNVILYDLPPGALQLKVIDLLKGTDQKLSQIEFGVDILPKSLNRWKSPRGKYLTLQAGHASKQGVAPELVFLFDLLIRLRCLTYGRLKLPFQDCLYNDFLTAYLNDPRADAVALKTYVGPGSEEDVTKRNFVRIEQTANRDAIVRMIKKKVLVENAEIRPRHFDLRDRLRLRQPRLDLIHQNLVRKTGDPRLYSLKRKGFDTRHDLTRYMFEPEYGLPLDQALIRELWRDVVGGSPPPYLFTQIFPAPR